MIPGEGIQEVTSLLVLVLTWRKTAIELVSWGRVCEWGGWLGGGGRITHPLVIISMFVVVDFCFFPWADPGPLQLPHPAFQECTPAVTRPEDSWRPFRLHIK